MKKPNNASDRIVNPGGLPNGQGNRWVTSKMRKSLLIIIGLLLTAVIFVLVGGGHGSWDGGAVCALAITVSDDQDRPIQGATVTLKYADFTGDSTKNQDISNYPILSSVTDAKGQCTITHHFPAGGETYSFFRTGRIGFGSMNVKAEHSGFASNEVAVSQFAGEHRNMRASRTITIPIKLTQPAAGLYSPEDGRKSQQ